MSPLHATVTFCEMYYVAVSVAEDLKFDMAWLHDKTLKQHTIVVKTFHSFAFAGFETCDEVFLSLHQPHPLASAAQRGLDQHGKLYTLCLLEKPFLRLVVAVVPRGHRHSCIDHNIFTCTLTAHSPDSFHRRADKGHAALPTCLWN